MVEDRTWRLLGAVLDRFVPPARRVDPVKLRQSHLLIGLLLLSVGTLPINMFYQVQLGRLDLLTVAVATNAVCWGCLLAYRDGVAHERVVSVLLGWGYVGILLTSAISGGLFSSVVPLLCLLPLFGLSLVDRRAAFGWMLACFLGLGGLAVSHEMGVLPPLRPDFESSVPWTSNLMLMLGCTGSVAWFLDSLGKLQQQELVKAKGRADDANAAKSAFLANMSHELRTPMNGVLGLTEIMLLDDTLTAQQRERLGTIYDSGRALVDLLNDILDLSRVEAGRLVLEKIPWEPGAVLRDVERLFGEVARRKGLDFQVELDPGMPRSVLGDPTRVRQVLCNLVGNAMKFTARGSVTLGSQWSDDRLVLFVRDTGPGISAGIQQAIFEPFTQEDSSTVRRYGGSGLGLAISRNLTLLMGGTLELQSQVGVGSCLRMTLPVTSVEPAGMAHASRRLVDEVEEVEATPEPVSRSTPADVRDVVESDVVERDVLDTNVMSGATILLVEDVPVNRLVVSLMLKDFGCQVDEAVDGEQALEKMLAGEPYAAVLMDWHLPKMDGVEATRHARDQGYTRPIIALTASVRSEDRDSVLKAGMDAFVGKPFTREELRHALESVLS